MKLFYSPASPYARKVLVLAHEKGIADGLELINVSVSPIGTNESLQQHNPLGKIPCLLLDDSRSLFDSNVITAYLDSLTAPPLNPDKGPARFDALTLEALADGILDSCLLLRYETLLRPSAKFWQAWHDGQIAKIDRGLDLLETRWIAKLDGPITIGVIAVACALGYLDFRFSDKNWRQDHPNVARFYSDFGARASMTLTRPIG
jgi:glutathione S-transferase